MRLSKPQRPRWSLILGSVLCGWTVSILLIYILRFHLRGVALPSALREMAALPPILFNLLYIPFIALGGKISLNLARNERPKLVIATYIGFGFVLAALAFIGFLLLIRYVYAHGG